VFCQSRRGSFNRKIPSRRVRIMDKLIKENQTIKKGYWTTAKEEMKILAKYPRSIVRNALGFRNSQFPQAARGTEGCFGPPQ
jgi:hypothetical protein